MSYEEIQAKVEPYKTENVYGMERIVDGNEKLTEENSWSKPEHLHTSTELDTVVNDKIFAELYFVEPKVEEDRPQPGEMDFNLELNSSEVDQQAEAQLTNAMQGNNKTKDFKHKEVLFECENCPYKTKYRHAIARHKQIHSNIYPFSCSGCTYKAREKRGLQEHMIRQHDKKGAYQCDQCTYTSSRASWLRQHISGTHWKSHHFTCPSCS